MYQPATPDATPAEFPGISRPGPETASPATPSAQSSGRRRPDPPRQEKPWPDFPLTWHKRGYWFKKHEGRQVNYEADWQESYNRYLKDKDAWEAGRLAPSRQPQGHTVREAVNVFLDRQQERVDDGKISEVQLAKYRGECERFGTVIGLTTRLRRLCGEEGPPLFRKAERVALARGLVVAERHFYCVRAMLELANKRGLMPPANYGEYFDKPGPEQHAQARYAEEAEHGERAWTVEELREIVAAAQPDVHLYAKVLLALNAGFGADDCALLRDRMIDRKLGLIRTHRGKTLRQRVAPLWDMTLAAIDASRAARARPADAADADRVFLTRNGLPVARRTVTYDDTGRVKKTGRSDAVRLAFDDLLVARQAEILRDADVRKARNLKPSGRPEKLRKHKAGFYTLRAMFRTLAVGAGVETDLIAVIKGQKFERPVDEYYLRGDLRAKLFQVTDHVYRQLLEGWSSPWPRPADEVAALAPDPEAVAANTTDTDTTTRRPRRRARTAQTQP